jgi:hypothetical protein
MKKLTYDSCLLYINKDGFGVISLQTNDTFFLVNKSFAKAEELKLYKANFLVKDKEQLTSLTLIKFNSGQIKL